MLLPQYARREPATRIATQAITTPAASAESIQDTVFIGLSLENGVARWPPINSCGESSSDRPAGSVQRTEKRTCERDSRTYNSLRRALPLKRPVAQRGISPTQVRMTPPLFSGLICSNSKPVAKKKAPLGFWTAVARRSRDRWPVKQARALKQARDDLDIKPSQGLLYPM
jgi:hypothetical protein